MNNYTLYDHCDQQLTFEPLPQESLMPDELGNDACKWLDNYVKFASKWSPRSYEGYHTACGLWVLSTIAAGRVVFYLGKCHKTNLNILLIGRTTVSAKSTAANIGVDVLKAAGLDPLLLPNTCTPQEMVKLMSSPFPNGYTSLSGKEKDRVELQIAYSGQRGWFYEEFGTLISGMMQKEGPLADFRGLLRRLDDTPDRLENGTITRGLEVVENPYLALLGCLTPADLKTYARKGSALWRDGFLARFLLIVPPPDFIKLGQLPQGQRKIPSSLIKPLIAWHQNLGIPQINSDGTKARFNSRPFKVLEITKEVFEAFYRYGDTLLMILVTSDNQDFDGNFGRLPEMALRIAALFASLEGNDYIELKHWVKAQGITETCRKNLYYLHEQLNDVVHTNTLTNEQKVLRIIALKENPNKREIEQCTRLPSNKIQGVLDLLIRTDLITSYESGKTVRYKMKTQGNMINPN